MTSINRTSLTPILKQFPDRKSEEAFWAYVWPELSDRAFPALVTGICCLVLLNIFDIWQVPEEWSSLWANAGRLSAIVFGIGACIFARRPTITPWYSFFVIAAAAGLALRNGTLIINDFFDWHVVMMGLIMQLVAFSLFIPGRAYMQLSALAILCIGAAGSIYWAGYPDEDYRVAFTLALFTVLGCIHIRQSNTALRRHFLIEEKVKSAVAQANSASEAKSNFLAAMSHEIRTPLNGVLGMANMLSRSRLNQEQWKQVETIRRCGQTLLSLVDDILDFSKIEARKLKMENRDFDFYAFVEDIETTWFHQFAKRKISFIVLRDDDVLPVLNADSIRLGQVLHNLLDNALKFTESGAVTVDIEQEPAEGGLYRTKFRVSDTGIGIAADQLPKLFDLFYQADQSTTRRYGGTGLGLSICKHLVDRMGGEVSIESKESVGTTIEFNILTGASIIDRTKKPDRPQAPDTDNPSDRPVAKGAISTVLVVDDNAVNLKVLESMLSVLGVTVELAQNGTVAVSMAAEKEYDAILMDIEMPEVNGLQATEMIRKQNEYNARVPIVAVTANAMKGDREKYLAAGMTDYLSKPLQVPALIKLLEDLAAGKSASPLLADDPAAYDGVRSAG